MFVGSGGAEIAQAVIRSKQMRDAEESLKADAEASEELSRAVIPDAESPCRLTAFFLSLIMVEIVTLPPNPE